MYLVIAAKAVVIAFLHKHLVWITLLRKYSIIAKLSV